MIAALGVVPDGYGIRRTKTHDPLVLSKSAADLNESGEGCAMSALKILEGTFGNAASLCHRLLRKIAIQPLTFQHRANVDEQIFYFSKNHSSLLSRLYAAYYSIKGAFASIEEIGSDECAPSS